MRLSYLPYFDFAYTILRSNHFKKGLKQAIFKGINLKALTQKVQCLSQILEISVHTFVGQGSMPYPCTGTGDGTPSKR